MPIRTFGLNSPEFYETYCRRECSELPREPNFPRDPDYVSVSAESEAEAQDAIWGWLRHVETGRIG